MKKIKTSFIVSGVRKLGAIKATIDHFNEMVIDGFANLIKGLIAGSVSPIAIHGCVNVGAGSNYDISAGAIFHNGEVFEINAFVGAAGGGQVPVLSLVTTYRAGDPVKYSDGSTQNTHEIRKYQWSFGAPGSGLADFSAVLTLKAKVLTDLLNIPAIYAPLISPALTGVPTVPTAAPGTNTTQAASTAFVKAAIDALIAAAPGALDTLDELAAALGDDSNFASTVTTALSGKVANSRQITTSGGLQGGGDLTADRDISIADGGVTTAKIGDDQVTAAKIPSGAVVKSGDAVQLLTKVIEIGDWNMDTTSNKIVAHGLADHKKIRMIDVIIREDTDTNVFGFFDGNQSGSAGRDGGLEYPIGDTNIELNRETGGYFDNAAFDSTGFNRGWITIIYEA